MPNMNLPSLELVATVRTVPLRGAPSSQDYNDSQREILADCVTIVSFINEVLLPIFSALPEAASTGLEGKTLIGDSADASELFFDSVAVQPLTVADVCRKLQAMVKSVESRLADLGVSVTDLQTRLASTNQNDIAQALQNFSASLQSLTTVVNGNSQAVSDQQVKWSKEQAVRVVTSAISASAELDVDVDWPTSFVDNSYTAIPSIEDSSYKLEILGWKKRASGVGITVRVLNTDPGASHSGTLHVFGRAD